MTRLRRWWRHPATRLWVDEGVTLLVWTIAGAAVLWVLMGV